MNTIAYSPPSISTPAMPLRWLALGGVLGPLVYTVAWLVLGLLSPWLSRQLMFPYQARVLKALRWLMRRLY